MKTIQTQLNDKISKIGRITNYRISNPQTEYNKELLEQYNHDILDTVKELSNLVAELQVKKITEKGLIYFWGYNNY